MTQMEHKKKKSDGCHIGRHETFNHPNLHPDTHTFLQQPGLKVADGEAIRRRRHLLRLKWGGLSLTSVSLTVTVVVPDNPPRCPPMSLACSTTRYSSRLSRSMSGTAVRRTPGGKCGSMHGRLGDSVCVINLKAQRVTFSSI